ncbi:MAG TPA: putative toxin-antitoxin system toxin component, PIN family [Bryobacteraceae bacterium]|nr:putative toxin-antitoxin system toxin component, PIN family [Bryobacteraceae bacterium]
MRPRGKQPRGVVDTSVLIAGIAGFKSQRTVENPSAALIRDWVEDGTFIWLLTEEIVSEYKGVLTRLVVRRSLVGEIINLLREEAEFVEVRSGSDVSPDPADNAFCACAEEGRAAFIVTLNRKDFPQKKLVAKVISPGDPIPTTRRRRSSRV